MKIAFEESRGFLISLFTRLIGYAFSWFSFELGMIVEAFVRDSGDGSGGASANHSARATMATALISPELVRTSLWFFRVLLNCLRPPSSMTTTVADTPYPRFHEEQEMRAKCDGIDNDDSDSDYGAEDTAYMEQMRALTLGPTIPLQVGNEAAGLVIDMAISKVFSVLSTMGGEKK